MICSETHGALAAHGFAYLLSNVNSAGVVLLTRVSRPAHPREAANLSCPQLIFFKIIPV